MKCNLTIEFPPLCMLDQIFFLWLVVATQRKISCVTHRGAACWPPRSVPQCGQLGDVPCQLSSLREGVRAASIQVPYKQSVRWAHCTPCHSTGTTGVAIQLATRLIRQLASLGTGFALSSKDNISLYYVGVKYKWWRNFVLNFWHGFRYPLSYFHTCFVVM